MKKLTTLRKWKKYNKGAKDENASKADNDHGGEH